MLNGEQIALKNLEVKIDSLMVLMQAQNSIWVTVETACLILGKKDRRSVYKLINKNAVKWRFDGKSYFINKQSIDAYIDSLKDRNIIYSLNK